jgi:DNA-binding transcriptional ArsR family regulator
VSEVILGLLRKNYSHQVGHLYERILSCGYDESRRTVERHLRKLHADGRVRRDGPLRSPYGGWRLV